MAIDLNANGIELNDPQFQQMLVQLQGNILKAHGRDRSTHLVLRFTGPARTVKEWIQNLARTRLTSAGKQLEEAKRFRQTGQPGDLFVSLFLSATGYKYLGFDPNEFDDENDTFRLGMKHRRRVNIFFPNKDPRVQEWEAPYQGEIHAMILLADDDAAKLDAAETAVKTSLNGVAQVLATEQGYVIRDAKGRALEQFGYIDGRSQPRVLKEELDREDKLIWDPSAPLGQFIANDPFNSAPDTFGSYFVFRKLEQKVSSFNLGVRELADRLGISEDLAGAMVVGRFKDGTPLTLASEPGLEDINDFNYREDRDALKCPFHGHIRKANQRGDTPLTSEESERSRRIMRRGVTYGKRAADLSDEPDSGVGLLFMCYQADIGHQFEFLQRVWFDNPRFPEILSETGDCPLIGQDGNEPQKWRSTWGEETDQSRINFGDRVRLKGGEYFFAPSVGFLQNIVADLP